MARHILRMGGRLRVIDDADDKVYYEYLMLPTYRVARSFALTHASEKAVERLVTDEDCEDKPVVIYRDIADGLWTVMEIAECQDNKSCIAWLDKREARYRGESVK